MTPLLHHVNAQTFLKDRPPEAADLCGESGSTLFKGFQKRGGKIRMKAKFPFSAFKFHTLSLDERNYEPITSY
jgi:hypothetical protein